MIDDLLIFVFSLFLVVKGATLATTYAERLAGSFRLSRYAVGFIIISIISILPETFISINAALQGVPSLGLGTLFGSNIADLTLIFAVIVLLAGRNLKVESKILKNNKVYPFLLLLPLILGLDSYYSRLDGTVLIVVGAIFYYLAFRSDRSPTPVPQRQADRLLNLLLLLASMAMLLVGSHFVVTSATSFANMLGISPVLIGMLIVGIGTTMPELFFAAKSVRRQDDALAVGDILGTVLADATIVVGILALIDPFAFSAKLIYVTGIFMVGASVMLLHLMSSGRTLSKKESYLLILYWAIFVLVEFLANS